MTFIFHKVGKRSFVVEEVTSQQLEIRQYLKWVEIFEDAGGYWP